MHRLRALFTVLLLAASFGGPAAQADDAKGHPVGWQDWTSDVFARAERENRYIILHMAAVWCHWCHVMEGTTYRDPAVLKLIGEKFIPVRVDQDSHPELSYRYENWGWPATIMFDKDGNEIFKRQGYLPPELFAKLLVAVIEDPSALPASGLDAKARHGEHALDDATREKLEELYGGAYDGIHGGFGAVHRFIHGDTVEYALVRGRPLRRHADPASYAEMARRTLAGANWLIDPVWGGMYQYSDALDWSSPHFEKLMNIQRDALRTYVLAHQITGDPTSLAAARNIARWLIERMRDPDGGFYVSQDADVDRTVTGQVFYALDDAGRRQFPEPRIDRNLYARESGWAAAGLAALYDVTGDRAYLEAAVRAVDWAIANRRAPSGGFGHARAAADDVHLGDTLAIGEAALALYRSTGERRWLVLAIETGRTINAGFRDSAGGFVVRQPEPAAIGVLRKAVKQIDENVAVVRFFNLLHRYSADPTFRAAAEHGMSWLVALAKNNVVLPGALLADDELAREPAHVTIVGSKDDPDAQALYAAARRYPTRYLRIEWWDRREGPLPNPDVEYPELPQAAAFACANGVCSLPVFTPNEVARIVRRVEDR
ncbi:MAG TPA: DUF255 domain-containing protein [Vineibacter sp.]|nr:DUF255 domain-containing protein [Vineibacter sp.]